MTEHNQIDVLKKIIEEQKIAISQISHEVRNPITLINSSLQLIEKQHPEVRDFLFWEDTMRDMKYLLRLLEELSNYNNSEKTNPKLLDAGRWLTEVYSSLSSLSSESFRFSFRLPEDLPAFYADPIKLRQAISNLIRNGFEALEGDGEVTLSASADEQWMRIRIADTGCGIPEEYMDTLFQPFVTHKQDGTGLGLSITKRIIEAHKGKLLIETIPEKGTAFTILLPLA
ncbi:MAG: sensor histidine kinase [Hominisplanchenecus sp.]